jgi:acetyltransferase-like isoleucine patch superfamily enzyme
VKIRHLARRLLWVCQKVRVQFADPWNRADLLRRHGSQIGQGCFLNVKYLGTEPFLVSIGDNCYVSAEVMFMTHDPAAWAIGPGHDQNFVNRIDIGDWCMVGARAILLPGTKLGDHCVVGAGAVVKGEFPAGSIIAGVPARVIGRLSDHAERYEKRQLPLAHRNRKELEQLSAALLPHPKRSRSSDGS